MENETYSNMEIFHRIHDELRYILTKDLKEASTYIDEISLNYKDNITAMKSALIITKYFKEISPIKESREKLYTIYAKKHFELTGKEPV